MAPFKVCNTEKKRKIGIVAITYEELVQKGCKKLQIPEKHFSAAVLEDGTEIDDDEYLNTLKPHTVITFLRKGETNVGGFVNSIKNLLLQYQKLTKQEEMRDQIKELILTEASAEENMNLLSEFIRDLHMNVEAETIEEDPDWFDGISGSSIKTKEQYFINSAKSRIRGYYREAKDYISNIKQKKTKQGLQEILEEFQYMLKDNGYHGGMFARTNSSERFCDEDGLFECQGLYDQEECFDRHTINPYGSKESRIVFSTWNLDHRIEKSREVLPSLEAAAASVQKGKVVNLEYFYSLLFTTMNLKLVHIACHDKTIHTSQKCDKKKFFKKM